ncbi:MAG: transporter substrate-binding domain-containing protein [Pseudomonadota bacterium]
MAALVTVFWVLLALVQAAHAAELVVIQREETSQNLADFAAGGRFQTKLGEMLAERMGRSPRFLDLPRKRMIDALESGDGDILCGYLPEWLPGAFDWSRPFIPVVQVVISASRAQRPLAISDLRGKRIGTVLGFSYPELEQELGKDFLRDDGPSMDSSLRKLAAGRFDHMVTTTSVLNAHLKQGDLPLPLHPPLVVKEFNTQCAVSRRGRIKLDELNKAIDSLAKSGELARLLQRYH